MTYWFIDAAGKWGSAARPVTGTTGFVTDVPRPSPYDNPSFIDNVIATPNFIAWVRDDESYLAAKKEEYEAAVERHLDSVAQAHGYNTIYSAISYVTSTDPKWSAEGTALRDWRDAVWVHVHAMYESIQTDFQQTGVLTIPELANVIAGLPEYTFEYVEPQ